MQLVRSKAYNRYDVYLFLIIFSALYGRYGLIHPTTFLSLWFLPELINSRKLLSSKKIKNVCIFLILWIFYATVSLLWSPKVQETYLGFSLLFVNSLLFMEIIVFSLKANNPLKSLVWAWVCAFLITSVVALWEIVTNNHLQSAKEMWTSQGALSGTIVRKYASFTFYNPNTYCYYISLVFPFALHLFFQSKKAVEYLYYIVPVLLIVFIMSQNSSRGGLLTLSIIFCTFIYFKMKNSSSKVIIQVVIWVFILALFLFLYGEIIFQALFYRLDNQEMFEDQARLSLMIASWHIFLDSYGFGSGTGSMVYALGHSSANPTRFTYAHNMMMEVLLEYGIIFGLGIILYLLKLFLSGRKIQDYKLKSVVLGSVFSFPFYSVINSESLTVSFVWMFFATIFVYSYIGRKGNVKEPFLRRINGKSTK